MHIPVLGTLHRSNACAAYAALHVYLCCTAAQFRAGFPWPDRPVPVMQAQNRLFLHTPLHLLCRRHLHMCLPGSVRFICCGGCGVQKGHSGADGPDSSSNQVSLIHVVSYLPAADLQLLCCEADRCEGFLPPCSGGQMSLLAQRLPQFTAAFDAIPARPAPAACCLLSRPLSPGMHELHCSTVAKQTASPTGNMLNGRVHRVVRPLPAACSCLQSWHACGTVHSTACCPSQVRGTSPPSMYAG